MLIECGFVRAVALDGVEFTFTPSLARIATLGNPHEIVGLYAALHGPQSEREAGYILACLCDQDDPTPLIGWIDSDGLRQPGTMPASEQVVIARHLMHHGIVGKAKPSRGGGQYSDRFDAAEYIAAARVHLGLSSADAEALSMTEFQMMLAMKYPESQEKQIPSRDEYRKAMQAAMKKEQGNGR